MVNGISNNSYSSYNQPSESDTPTTTAGSLAAVNADITVLHGEIQDVGTATGNNWPPTAAACWNLLDTPQPPALCSIMQTIQTMQTDAGPLFSAANTYMTANPYNALTATQPATPEQSAGISVLQVQDWCNTALGAYTNYQNKPQNPDALEEFGEAWDAIDSIAQNNDLPASIPSNWTQ